MHFGVRKSPDHFLRIAFGFVWLADAVLKWVLLLNGFSYANFISSMARGQPPVIASWIAFWSHAIVLIPSFALLLAIAETYIAFSLLLGFMINYTCVIGISLNALIWSTGEGFGNIFTGTGTDIGPSPVYILIFVTLLIIVTSNKRGTATKISITARNVGTIPRIETQKD